MKKMMKPILLIVFAVSVAIVLPYLGSNEGCTCRLPLVIFGSTLGCSESKQPEMEPGSENSDIQSSIHAGTRDKAISNTEHKVTFVEIGSVNCIPCKMMQPIMKAVEEDYRGQVKVVFYDVWTPEGRPFGEIYGIRVIPTQVFLDRDGKEYYRHEGFYPKEELVKILKMKGVE